MTQKPKGKQAEVFARIKALKEGRRTGKPGEQDTPVQQAKSAGGGGKSAGPGHRPQGG